MTDQPAPFSEPDCSDCPIPSGCTTDCYLARGNPYPGQQWEALYVGDVRPGCGPMCDDDCTAHQLPDPGQRYRLSPEALRAVDTAYCYGDPMPDLILRPDGVTLDPWPTPATNTPTTSAPANTGPTASPPAPSTATPPSASTATAPSPEAHPAAATAGTSDTGPTAPPSADPNTPAATAAKAQHAATEHEPAPAALWLPPIPNDTPSTHGDPVEVYCPHPTECHGGDSCDGCCLPI